MMLVERTLGLNWGEEDDEGRWMLLSKKVEPSVQVC
jgi:hypothetical protein